MRHVIYSTFRRSRLTPFALVLALLTAMSIPQTASAQDTGGTTYLPIISTIPRCNAEQIKAYQTWDGKTNATPDYESKEGCQLPIFSAPLDLPRGVMPDEVAAADFFTTNKYAKHNLNCTTCNSSSNGILALETINSAKEPYLSGGGSWTNYWWGNGGTVFTNQVITCQNGVQLYRQIGVGIGKGRLTSSINMSAPTLYSIVASPGYCYGFTTYYTIAPYSAITLSMYKEANNTWSARAWLGQWYYLFNNDATIPGYAQGISVGQEVGAADGNFAYLKVPMNFAHKIKFVAGSYGNRIWADNGLPAYMTGITTSITNSPFNVMDLIGGDYTSISAEIN